MEAKVNKLKTAIDVLCENFFEYTCIEAIEMIADDPHFEEEDMEDFIHYAIECNKTGVIPSYTEWFNRIAPEKTGSSSH